jgi:S1-C subfamily serine protease
MQYGKVQRALLGVSIQEINQQLADEKSLADLKGVYIADVADGGAAAKGGIKAGDVILKINGTEVNSGSKLQEEVGKNKPGDEVTVSLRRKGELKEVKVTLLSEEGDTKLETAARETDQAYLGLKLESTSREERTKLGMKNAVRAVEVEKGVFKDAGMEKGFLITHINNEPVYSAQGAISMLKGLRGAVAIEGKTASGAEKVLAVKLPAKSE